MTRTNNVPTISGAFVAAFSRRSLEKDIFYTVPKLVGRSWTCLRNLRMLQVNPSPQGERAAACGRIALSCPNRVTSLRFTE